MLTLVGQQIDLVGYGVDAPLCQVMHISFLRLPLTTQE